jgi:hypothetical protein
MEMKFIITESRREQLIDKYLSKDYGGLIRYDDTNRDDLIFFIKDTGKKPHKNDIVFFYNKDSQSAYVPSEMVRDVELFTGDEWVAKQLVKKWLKKTYGIDPVKLFKKF